LAGVLAVAACGAQSSIAQQRQKQADLEAKKKAWPWMNTSLSPDERADLVLKEMTLDEKILLLHGNGMAHAGIWQMPLTK